MAELGTGGVAGVTLLVAGALKVVEKLVAGRFDAAAAARKAKAEEAQRREARETREREEARIEDRIRALEVKHAADKQALSTEIDKLRQEIAHWRELYYQEKDRRQEAERLRQEAENGRRDAEARLAALQGQNE